KTEAPMVAPEPTWDLMAAPLDGRPPQPLASNLKGNLDLVGIGDYVYWRREVSPASPFPADLLRFRFGDSGHVLLRGVPGPAPSFELGGRLYWLEPSGPGRIPTRRWIVTTTPDGSDRRVLFRIPPDARVRWAFVTLAAHRGRVYCMLAEEQVAART